MGRKAATPPSLAAESAADKAQARQVRADPPTPYDAPWELTRPTAATQNILVIDRTSRCRATVKVVPGREAEAEHTAKLIQRAPAMRVLLSHVLEELKGDDDGSRFAAEIKLIDQELKRTALPEGASNGASA